MANLQSINVQSGALTLPVGSIAQRPTLSSGDRGYTRINNSFSPPQLEVWDGSSWVSLTGKTSGTGLSSSTPAASPDEILDAYPEADDGLYWIDVEGTARQIWCDMKNGGWMLAARFNNSSNSWQADDGKWTNTDVLNSTSSSTDNQDIKTYAWFWSNGGNMRVRWCLGFRHNWLEEWWYHTSGIRGIFADTPYVTTNADWNVPRGTRHTRQDFEEWFNRSIDVSGTPFGSYTGRAYQNGNGASWSNCNMRGVNMSPNSGGQRLRFGTTLNNEADCSSNDYEWGIGMTGGRAGSYSVGRRANYNAGPYQQTTTNITGWCFVK